LLSKHALVRLVIPVKPLDSGAGSRKRGGKMPDIAPALQSSHRLWPRSAKIARLDKTAFLP
jgi:hypothetical protein